MIKTVTAVLATTTCLVAFATPAVAQTQSYDIPAGSLKAALDSYARSSGRQVIYKSDQVRGKRSHGARGSYSPDTALEALLVGTGMTVRRGDAGAVSIVPLGRDDVASQETSSSTGENAGSGSIADNDAATEITVTGTRIRGVRNETAPIIRYDRKAIESAGYATTQDLVRSIPQTFGGGSLGASEDGLVGQGGSRATNYTSASGINLRGLGTNSTLVLLNGRRMAPSQFGQTVDISILPLSAINSVDVLTDGASALYGSDAVAGVVNITLRDKFQGAETSMRLGQSSDGGRAERTLSQTLGHEWGSGSVLASVQYQDLDRLRSDQRDFTKGRPNTDVFPETTAYSGVLVVEQSLDDNVDFFAQALYTTKDIFRNNRLASIQERIDSDTKNFSLSFGGTVKLFSDWRASTTFVYGRDQGAMDQDQVNISTSATTHVTQKTTYETKGIELVFDGSLLELPAGAVRAALGGSYRDDKFHQDAFSNGVRALDRSAGTKVWALFGELYAPVISPKMAVPGVHAFEVSAAARYDDYNIFGSTLNPRLGVLYAPFEHLRLRASYSESFRAPNPSEQFVSLRPTNLVGIAMGNPTGTGNVLGFIIQGSTGIGPETATSFTFGFDLELPILEGLKITFNRYDIAYKNRIILPTFDTNALRQPAVYGSLISTLSDNAAAQAIIDAVLAGGGSFFDVSGVGAVGVRYMYDQRQINAARVDQSGIDLTIAQQLRAGDGMLSLRLNGSYIEEIDTQLVSGAATTDLVGTYGNPANLRLRADANWANEFMSINAALNYVDGYRDTRQTTTYHVDSWTTFDLGARFQLGSLLGRSKDKVVLGVAIQNVFNTDPPYVRSQEAIPINYDPGNASPLGRFMAIEFRIGW